MHNYRKPDTDREQDGLIDRLLVATKRPVRLLFFYKVAGGKMEAKWLSVKL